MCPATGEASQATVRAISSASLTRPLGTGAVISCSICSAVLPVAFTWAAMRSSKRGVRVRPGLTALMKMRAADTLALPAGRAVRLAPGGYHFMLMDLQAPFRNGSRIPMTLRFKDARGKLTKLLVTVPVLAGPPAATQR